MLIQSTEPRPARRSSSRGGKNSQPSRNSVGLYAEARGMENEHLPAKNETEEPIQADPAGEPQPDDALSASAPEPEEAHAEEDIIIPLRLADRRPEAFLPEWLRRLNWA